MPQVSEQFRRSDSEPVASLDEIAEVAETTESQLRTDLASIKPTLCESWYAFKNQLSPQSDGWWVGPSEAFERFELEIPRLDDMVTHDGVNKLSRMMGSRAVENDDWRILAAFLPHDMSWLGPMVYFQMNVPIGNRWYQTKRTEVHERHISFFDRLAASNFRAFDQMILPVRFVRQIVDFQQGHRIPAERFRPVEMLSDLVTWAAGRFYMDDYNILVNPSPDLSASANCLVINCHPDLELVMSQPMLYAVVKNLVDNAAKANARSHQNEESRAASFLYYKEGQLKNPRSLSVSVSPGRKNLLPTVRDEGPGLSLDDALHRMHEAMSEQLESKTPEQIRQSEWYWAMRRQIGKRQAEYLMSWPTNPDALRQIKVGTIFDTQFIAGFSGKFWRIPSLTTGLGLWGVRYVTECLGGTVFGTNSFDGGAIFSVSIPKTSVGLSPRS